MKLLQELRRRRVFRLAGLYIVGAWVVIQVADIAFEALAIPGSALLYLFIAAALLFPVALIFGWTYDITPDGIVRTPQASADESVDASLRGSDYLILAALAVITVFVVLGSLQQVAVETTEGPGAIAVERIENSIAVLPFKNLDAQLDTEYFSDGITEEILHSLSPMSELHVIASTSSFAFRNSEDSAADISGKLGVQYLLHGSVRRDSNLVRVTARLIDSKGLQVWSQSFERTLEAVFAIQTEIASSVASNIIREIIAPPEARPATANAEAYDEYLLGRSYTRSRTDDWNARSEAAFRRAIDLDPEFGPAHAGLAYSLFVWRSGDTREEALREAEKALELAPNLAEAHAVYGLIKTGYGNDPVAGERSLRRAIELDPSYPESYNWLSFALSLQDREAEGNLALEQGYAIDPLSPTLALNLANHFARQGEFTRAERMMLRLTQVPNPTFITYVSLFNLYADWGRYAEAIRWSDRGEFWQGRMICYAALGMMAEANQLFDANEDVDPDFWFGPGNALLQMQGRHEEAFEHLMAVLEPFDETIDTLTPTGRAQALSILVAAGRYDESLRVYDKYSEGDPETFWQQVEAGTYFDAAPAIAYAFQQSNRPADADAILQQLLDNEYLASIPPEPRALARIAQLRSMSGDIDGAYAALSQAVDLGWAGYYAAINDARWGDTLTQPRLVELLERVQDNLAQQRADVERREVGRE